MEDQTLGPQGLLSRLMSQHFQAHNDEIQLYIYYTMSEYKLHKLHLKNKEPQKKLHNAGNRCKLSITWEGRQNLMLFVVES